MESIRNTTSRLLTVLLLATVSINYSFAQKRTATYYCQGCCSGVGHYYLMLDTLDEFELLYSKASKSGEKDNSLFGIGSYRIENKTLTLTFQDIPHERVELTKIRDSNTLTINFHVLDNIRGDSIPLINVQSKRGSPAFYPNPRGKITVNKFSQSETITFSAFAFKDLTFTITEPGEYEMIVRLNPEAKELFKAGDKMSFDVMETGSLKWFRSTDDRDLKFTTKSCRRR